MAHTDCCCCTGIEQGNVGIVENMGQFAGVVPPGCHCISVVGVIRGTLSLKAQYLAAEVQSVTADQANVTCSVGIMFRVMPEKCHLAFYRLAHPFEQIRSFVIASVRPYIITRTLDELFVEKEQLSNSVKKELDHKMAEFGYEILDVLFVNLGVEARVRESMNQQMTQQYNRLLAEVQQKTSNIRQITLSNAAVEVERLEGVGTAEARKVLSAALTSGSHEDSHHHQAGNTGDVTNQYPHQYHTEKEVMSMMLLTQYFDMLRDVKKTLTYFLPLARAAEVDSAAAEEDAIDAAELRSGAADGGFGDFDAIGQRVRAAGNTMASRGRGVATDVKEGFSKVMQQQMR